MLKLPRVWKVCMAEEIVQLLFEYRVDDYTN